MNATNTHLARQRKNWRARRHANGGQSVLCDATPLRPILHDMHARMSWASVAVLVGTTHGHISAIANGRTKRIHPDLFARILANTTATPTTGPTLVSPRSAVRRVRALHAIGYSVARLTREMGDTYSEGNMKRLMRGHTPAIHASTDTLIRDAYNRLSMTLPDAADRFAAGAITRSRNAVRANGWAPPLAWDDIDNDTHPTGARPRQRTTGNPIDPNVVDQLLHGQRVPSTVAEKTEAMRRWLASGRPQKQLCVTHGWKEGRYKPRQADAA